MQTNEIFKNNAVLNMDRLYIRTSARLWTCMRKMGENKGSIFRDFLSLLLLLHYAPSWSPTGPAFLMLDCIKYIRKICNLFGSYRQSHSENPQIPIFICFSVDIRDLSDVVEKASEPDKTHNSQ